MINLPLVFQWRDVRSRNIFNLCLELRINLDQTMSLLVNSDSDFTADGSRSPSSEEDTNAEQGEKVDSFAS